MGGLGGLYTFLGGRRESGLGEREIEDSRDPQRAGLVGDTGKDKTSERPAHSCLVMWLLLFHCFTTPKHLLVEFTNSELRMDYAWMWYLKMAKVLPVKSTQRFWVRNIWGLRISPSATVPPVAAAGYGN